MDLHLASVDADIAERQRRAAHAESLGPLPSPSSAFASSRRTLPVVMTAVGTLLRAIGTASRSAGDLARDGRDSLRSKEHDLADQGITWPADTVYDHVLAEEVRYARQRRLAARAITLPAPTHIAPNHCTETVEPRMSNGETFVRVRGRLRVSLPSAAVGVTGQAGD